ncbi:hypothetical protein GC207_15615 [bacterium]|nr:hypothetical protein [bacterium]
MIYLRFFMAGFASRAFSCALISLAAIASLRAAESNSVPPPLTPADNLNITIPRSALGKDYLMSMSVIPQAGAPTSRGLSGKVVEFELFHDGVDMYESSEGMVVTTDLPSRLLLATFPIVEQDDSKIVIDFNKGMRRVFTEGWYGGSGGFRPSESETVEEVPDGRVFAVNETGDQLVIRQSVQSRDREFAQNVESRYEIRYFFIPYVKGDFDAREMAPYETRYARFWELPGKVETESGRTTIKMGRFDIAKPVKFYYSANTPKDYVGAVKDGILYWNRAFGRDVVQVEEAPDGVTAPDSRYNIVQWVPWDSAGFAYADVLFDPLTGRARHGQAYMTSVFGIVGKSRARVLLRAMREIADSGKKEKGDDKPKNPGLRWLYGQTACQLDPVAFAQQMADGLEELLADDALTDEAVLRASQDYVREVVSHEVGHVLGLRHNFAGSLAATMSPKELDEFIKDYVRGKDLEKYKDKNVSNSMMEYTVFKGSVFVGWKMRNTTNALPHDQAAIQWGYFDNKSVVTNKMLFATDQDASKYGDVTTFDYGNEPVLAAYSDLSDEIVNLPNNVIETYIRAKAPRDPRDRVPLERVNLSFQSYANQIGADYDRVLRWFKASTRSLKVENQFDFIGDLNEKERKQAHWLALTNQIEKLGGIDRVGFAWLPTDLKLDTKKEPEGVVAANKIVSTNLAARLEKLLQSPAYTNFVGLDEKKYSFTPDEQKLIVKQGRKMFKELEEAVLARVLKSYENAPRDLGLEAFGVLDDDDVVSQLEKRIVDLAKYVIMTKNDDNRIKGKVDKAYVEVVDFKYEQETRLAAAKALNDKTGSYPAWSKEAKGGLNKSLKDEVEGALNVSNFKDFKDSVLSRPLREWYLRQQEILKLLPPTKDDKPDDKK